MNISINFNGQFTPNPNPKPNPTDPEEIDLIVKTSPPTDPEDPEEIQQLRKFIRKEATAEDIKILKEILQLAEVQSQGKEEPWRREE